MHATVEPDLDLEEQLDPTLFWQFFVNPTRHKSGETIVCGHTSQQSVLPCIFDKGVCIDIWAHSAGWLTCFDVTRDTFVQCNHFGQRRTFSLRTLTERGS